MVIGRALALALRGHRELVLENLALRQQLTAVNRTTKRPHLLTRVACFGSPWREAGGTGAPPWCSCSRAPSCDGIATGSAADGADVRNPDRPAPYRSADPHPRPRDGDGEPVVGSAADSWRAAHSRCRRLRTHGLAPAGTTSTSPVANVEDVPHESPQFSCVDGFFTIPTLTGRVLFVVVLLSHHRRRIVHVNITDHPTATWSAQQVVDAFSADTAPRWLHRDRDRIYGDVFQRRLAGIGIAEVVSAPASPWQNPYVERLIGSIRRECLDHVIVLNEAHLRRVLTTYSRYYHRSRTHLGLEKDTPDHRPVSGTFTGPIVAIPEVGGLHHRYERRAA